MGHLMRFLKSWVLSFTCPRLGFLQHQMKQFSATIHSKPKVQYCSRPWDWPSALVSLNYTPLCQYCQSWNLAISLLLMGLWGLLGGSMATPFYGYALLPQVDVLAFFHLTDNYLWSIWSENTERKAIFCPLKCSLDRRILQPHEPSYCVKYDTDDAFEKEAGTEVSKW